MNPKLLTLATMLALASLCWAQDSTLKIGFIDPDAAALIGKNKPMADYLGKNLGKYGVTSATTVVAKDYAEMARLLKAKKADLYIDTVFPVLSVKALTDLNIDLRRWKKGVGEYNTIFITAKNSPITSLKDLKGKTLGFEDTTSSSGRWMPQATLLKMGYSLEQGNAGSGGKADKVSYIFTGSPENTAVWLVQGKIDVGCISSTDLTDMSSAVKANIRQIGETGTIPRQLIASRADLPKPLVDGIKAMLVDLDKTPEGQALLKAWEKTSKVDAVGPELRQAIADIAKLWTLVESELK
jgi:phosphonate transport system substrate-binding protein